MRLPLQTGFRNMNHSGAVERAVAERAAGLERFSDRIVGCRFVVETGPRHHRGNLSAVRIDPALPGHEIVVGREPALHHAFEDVPAGFDRLGAGDAVRFHEESGGKGPRGRVTGPLRRTNREQAVAGRPEAMRCPP